MDNLIQIYKIKEQKFLFISGWILFIISRLIILFFITPVSSDIRVYFYNYATKMIYAESRAQFFSLVEFEYPPLFSTVIYTVLLITAFLKQIGLFTVTNIDELYKVFNITFRLFMFIFDIIIFILIPKFLKKINIEKNTKIFFAQLLYIFTSTLLGHLIFDRYDIMVGCIIFIALFCLFKCIDENQLIYSYIASFLLGISVSLKITPIFIYPVILIFCFKNEFLKNKLYALKSIGINLFYFLLAIFFGFFPYFNQYGKNIFKFISYHTKRGLHSESIYASFYYLASFLRLDIPIYHEFGSWNIKAKFYTILLEISSILVIISLIIFLFYLIYQILKNKKAELSMDKRNLLYSITFSFFISIIFSKVFSPQYIFWFLPILVLLPFMNKEKEYLMIINIILLTIFTYLIFPHFFFSDVIKLTTLGKILIISRNFIFIFLAYLIFKKIKKSFSTCGRKNQKF